MSWSVAERWAVNASPLIALGRIGRLDLLPALTEEVVVPEAVAAEIRRVEDEARISLAASRTRAEAVEPHPLVVPWGLGAGETAVLSFAKRHSGWVAVIDDLAARRCASALQIPTRGTVGIVLLAKTRGLIPSARSLLAALQNAGFYLAPELVVYALSLVGENTDE